MFGEKLFKRLFKKGAHGGRIGTRFPIMYYYIAVPFYHEVETQYGYTVTESDDRLPIASIWRLWTIVEVIGDGMYLDLLTGEIFVDQISKYALSDTVTPAYEDIALAQRERFLSHPLAIEIKGVALGITNSEVTEEIKEIIINKSIPRKDEIIAVLNEAKKDAVAFIEKSYEQLNQRTIEARKRVEEQLKKEKEEAERAAKEAERQAAIKAQEEKERLQAQAEVERKFKEQFPKVKQKKRR